MTLALVTGAHGFLGQNLARFLSRNGRTVVGVGHGSWPESRDNGVARWVNGEVDRDNLDLLRADAGQPHAIFHLAGGSLVGPSFVAPLEDFRRSVESTAKLLDWIRDKSPATRLIFVSSAAVYGSGHTSAIGENAQLAPQSPYGFHKLMAEALCRSYATHFGLNVSIVRLFSVYGPGLRKQLLWDMCLRIDRGENPLQLGGTGEERRDWIHISDAVRLLTMAENAADTRPSILNGGTGQATTVARFARMVTDAWGAAPAVFSGSSRPGDPVSLVAEVSAAAHLGFAPHQELADGVKETVAWFRREAASRK